MHVRFRSILAASALGLCIATVLGTAPAYAQAPQARATYQFDLPAQPLADTLRAIARQSGANVLFESKDVNGIGAPALRATLTASEAVDRTLAGTGLSAQQTTPTTVVIRRTSAAGGREPPPSTQDGNRTEVDPAAEEPTAVEGDIPPGASAQEAQASGSGASTMDTMIVTGTRIRGGETPSPVITIGSENIREEGFTDLGNVIRSIPQNFSGGQNPEVGSGGLSGAGAVNRNVTGGSGLNLRGLGPDATLTLLNGRRPSYSGTVQSVDISAIPVDAIDRIEIVADGASAIYGSDAVGGVGNVILRRDFDGLSVGAHHGAATAGGLTTREYVATTGTTWESGGWIGTWKQSSVDPIYASQRSYTNHLVPPTTIYPGSSLRSGLVSGYQRVGDRTELRLDALRTRRDQTYYYEYFGTNWIRSETTTGMLSPGIEITLASDWTLTLGGSWSRDEYEDDQAITDAATGISTVINNKSRSYEVGAEGPWFSVSGGDVRVAIGAGYRWNEFALVTRSTETSTVGGEESSRFAYAEMAVPLIGPEQQVTNVRRLELTAAVRGEDYRTVGSVVTPKFGVIYGPSRDITLKTSWGKAFKAPTLNERYSASVAYLLPPSYFGGSGYDDGSAALYVGGGNPYLRPERARTWTTTLAFHPAAIPGFEAEIAYFDIDYRDRVVEPIWDITQAMSNPNYEELIEYDPAAEEQDRVLAEIDHFFNFIGAPYDPYGVAVLIYGRRANVARQSIRGIDLSGSHRFDVARGELTIRGSGSWLDSSQENIAGQGAYDLSGTLFNPARRRVRIGAVWNQGGFNASAFANYTAGVEDVSNAETTASFTTFDAAARYEFNGRGNAWSGLGIALSAHNLLNRAPPLHVPALAAYAAPYDGTNYSAVGRFLALSISKHF